MAGADNTKVCREPCGLDLIKACSELTQSVKELIEDENSVLSKRILLLESQNSELSISLTSKLAESARQIRLATARADELDIQKDWLTAAEKAHSEQVRHLEQQIKAADQSREALVERISSLHTELNESRTEKNELSSYADRIESDMNKLQRQLKEEQDKSEDLNSCLVQMQRHYDVLHSNLREQRSQKVEEKERCQQKDYDFGAVLFAMFSHLGKEYKPDTLRAILAEFFDETEVASIMNRESAYGKWVRGALNRPETLHTTPTESTRQKRLSHSRQEAENMSTAEDAARNTRTKRLARGVNVATDSKHDSEIDN